MGVTDLWSVLCPVRESVPLYSLTGKTLAVDLSLWVCEAQHVQGMMGKVTRPHLRNLFFRASSLLRMGIKLVFVMEGEAPKIKAETMSRRTQMNFRNTNLKQSVLKPAATNNTSRARFKDLLRECAEMLDYLGIPWVSAAGEAEAMCAFLDAQGLVDGCITSDGDAFLYGAQTVYRNFNMNTKDPQIDCYKMSRVESELQLKRETLVGLAVLLGCDYIPKGVPGVGKEQALKLIQSLKETTLLQKLSDWQKTPEIKEFPVKKITHCLVCRHPGSAKAHERGGCVFCDSEKFCQPQDYDSQCPCDWHRTEHARQASSIEMLIKKKTLACELFPFTEIINEFMVSKDKAVTSFKRRKPNLLLMQNFALIKMEWPKHYTSQKVLSLMTYTELMNRSPGTQSSTQMQPIRIYKQRIRNGISCFEIFWSKPDHYVFPEDCTPDGPDVVRTVEEENLFTVAFPDLVKLFNKETAEAKDNKLKKKKPKADEEKPVVSSDGVSDLLARMTLKSSSHPEPVVPSEKGLQTVLTVLETNPDCFNTATLSTASKPTTYPISQEIQPASHPSSLRNQPEVPASLCHTGTPSQAQSSPSVAVVIDELHLSSIDWDASSFTAAPSPQSHPTKADRQQANLLERGNKAESSGTSPAVRSTCVELAAPQADRLSKYSLLERVRLKNLQTCIQNNGSKIESFGSELKCTEGQKPVSEKPIAPPKLSLISCTLATDSNERKITPLQQPKDLLPVKAPAQHEFVQVKHINRPSTYPEKTNRNTVCKKSVCRRQDSGGDHSDVENRSQAKPHISTPKAEVQPKPLTGQKTVQAQQLIQNSSLSSVDTHHRSDSTTPEKPPHTMGFSRTNTRTQTCSTNSDDDDDDDDDSDASICSPLPLAERLKLKFKK